MKKISFAVILVFLFYSGLSASDRKNVLVFHSYHQGMRWTDSITKGVEDIFRQHPSIRVNFEYMDINPGSGEIILSELARFYSVKYRNRKIDLIISSDDKALSFLLKYGSKIFRGVPVVFCGVNFFKDSMLEGVNNFTGILETYGYKETIDAARKITPGIRFVYVISDNSPFGKQSADSIRSISREYNGKVDFIHLTDMTMDEIKFRVKTLQRDSIVLLTFFSSDRNGSRFLAENSVGKISGASSCPVYGCNDLYSGHGMLGGMITKGNIHGEEAAKIALDILNGRKPSEIPVIRKSTGSYIFDYNVMKKFNVRSTRLPERSTVINEPDSFYNMNREFVWFMILLMCLASFMVFHFLRRRTVEQKLEHSESRFRDMAELLPEVIYEMDFNDNIVYTNRKGLEQFQYSFSEIREKVKITSVIDREYHREMNRVVAEIRDGVIRGSQKEYMAVRKDGTKFPVLIQSSPLYRNGKICGVRGILIDITERKKVQEQLNAAQRMESIGTLAGGIAHDFNNILAGVQGHAELLKIGCNENPDVRENIESILKYIRSASDLTKQLLGFARAGKYDLKPVDLNRLMGATVEMFSRTKKELVIETRLCGNPVVSVVDRSQIEQVILNLLVNAWQAMPCGGMLFIETDIVMPQDENVPDVSLSPGEYSLIRVTDTGVGMEQSVLERIFEPFFTTKPMGRGTGLGLAASFGIIQNHGGIIHAESKPGEGSVFSVYLPNVQDMPVDYSAPEDSITFGRGLVLLIDDEKMIRSVGSRILRHLGYRVITAECGMSGVEVFGRMMDDIDLVILDLIMPGMNGTETFNILRRIKPGIRILLSSGYSMNDEVASVMNAGCNGFIQKPFTMAELSKKLSGIIVTEDS